MGARKLKVFLKGSFRNGKFLNSEGFSDGPYKKVLD